MWCGINVHRVDVVSTESGADDPSTCGDGTSGANVSRKTYFDATFCSDGYTGRLLSGDALNAWSVGLNQVPSMAAAVVIVNHTKYGGAGGKVAWFSLASNASLIGVHELGHAAFELADEYDDRYNNYTGGEPSKPNITVDTNRATNKWRDLIQAATPMPTMSNPNCTTPNTASSPVAPGTVGTFEGAHRYHCGVFRPVFICYMRSLGSDFCPVCQRAIRQVLTPFQPAESLILTTPSISFLNIPEGLGGAGVTTYRAIVFEVVTCLPKTLRITAGPTGGFGTPLGTSITVLPAKMTPLSYGRLWLSYTSTSPPLSSNGSVTVRCDETGQEWVINISANTVPRPKSAVALVLDHSGSMAGDAGDGTTKVQKLRQAADIFINVMLEGDGVGIVAFDHTVQELMAITDVGPTSGVGGRSTATGHINSPALNPAGATSIGGGVVKGKQSLDNAQAAALPLYDVTAIAVLTDGMENTVPMLSSVSTSITANTFAIGLGQPYNISTAALQALTQGHNGYLLITGMLTTDQTYRLSKYFLQILAGITNANIVLDPQGVLAPGSEHRIPFFMNEADYGLDAILLTPYPEVIEFELQTPGGQRITMANVNGFGSGQFVVKQDVSYYRLSLPAIPREDKSSHSGRWEIILRFRGDNKEIDKWLEKTSASNPSLGSILSQGVIPYNVLVHCYSSLDFKANAIQSNLIPGSDIQIFAYLKEYDQPVDGRARVWAEITEPLGNTMNLPLQEYQPGIFRATHKTSLSGVYTMRVRALGETFYGAPFSREQTLSAVIYPDGGARESETELCRILDCILNERNLPSKWTKRFEEDGFSLKRLRKCVQSVCRNDSEKLEKG
jgi:hypothetical protein